MYRAITIAERQYRGRILWALGAAAILHLLVFTLIPPFEFTPYRMTSVPLVNIDFDPVDIPLAPPEEIPQPRIAPPIVDDRAENEAGVIDFPKNIPGGINDIVPVLPHEIGRSSVFDTNRREPVLMKIVRAEYPKLAWMAGIEGTVVFKVLVGADGRVGNISVLSSNVTREMEKAAMNAVSQFVFEPALQGVVPVPAMMRVPYTFNLH